jgi:hypothetical protein
LRIGTSLPIRGIGDIDAVPSWKNAFSFSHRDHGPALENTDLPQKCPNNPSNTKEQIIALVGNAAAQIP